MNRIKIKPLSSNDAWKGRRFKTDLYKNYEKALLFKLDKGFKLPEAPYEIHFEFGFSNKASDWDNPIKSFQDILQKKYKFNDKDIYRAVVEKKIVPKGEEYVQFDIISFKP
jgi:Holliday junction resolvase RusA-like endonuclease